MAFLHILRAHPLLMLNYMYPTSLLCNFSLVVPASQFAIAVFLLLYSPFSYAQIKTETGDVSLIAGGDVQWSMLNTNMVGFTLDGQYYVDRTGGHEWTLRIRPELARRAVQRLITPRAWQRPYFFSSIDEARLKLGNNVADRLRYSPFYRVMMVEDVFRSDEQRNRYPLLHVADVLRDADIAFVNLETPLSDTARRSGKFITPTSFADALAWAGIDVVSLANNHIFDGDEPGMFDTIDTLDAAGIAHSGAGRDLAAARQPAVVERGALTFAFLSYTMHENAGPRAFALPDRSGVAPADIFFIEEDVIAAKQEADVVVVSLHWGLYETTRTHEFAREMAHRIVDAGASLILGHGPHIPKGIEYYGGAIISYSLSNLLFSHGYTKWIDNFLLSIVFDGDGIKSAHIIPISGHGIDVTQPEILAGDRAGETITLITDLSADLGTELVRDGDVARVVLQPGQP